ncbi:MAG: response regulator transcription factor [Anaerolineales bacterium]|nr:response regulator transcription factor [Anaerolineales bacterium]
MINILVVHEYELMCHIISAVFDDEDDIHVAGSATDLKNAIRQIKRGNIDIVLVSTRLPDQGALKLTKKLLKEEPEVKIIALGISENKGHILQFVEAGVNGYVLHENSLDDLIETIHAVHADRAFVSPEIASALIERVSQLTQAFEQIGVNVPETIDLTNRELEVLELLNQDLSNKEIADRLVIEVGTVKNHVHNILGKLGVNTREDAAALQTLIENRSEASQKS